MELYENGGGGRKVILGILVEFQMIFLIGLEFERKKLMEFYLNLSEFGYGI